MLATEIDTDSAFIASTNVRKNKLQSMITGMTWYGFYIYFHQNVHNVITRLGNTCFYLQIIKNSYNITNNQERI